MTKIISEIKRNITNLLIIRTFAQHPHKSHGRDNNLLASNYMALRKIDVTLSSHHSGVKCFYFSVAVGAPFTMKITYHTHFLLIGLHLIV